MRLRWFFAIFLLLGEVGRTEGVQPPLSQAPSKRVLLLTVPKSGTYLVKRAVRLILGVSEGEVSSIDSVVMNDPSTYETMAQDMLLYLHEIQCLAGPADKMAVAAFARQLKDSMGKGGKPQLIREDPRRLLKEAKGLILFDHLWPEYEVVNRECADKYIKIVMIRDPRDTLISQVEWVREGKPWWMPIALLRGWRALPFDEHLACLIELPEEYGGIQSFCRTAVEWQKYKDVLFCRFEDLIGPAGGGDRQRQELALTALAEHLEHPLSREEIGSVAPKRSACFRIRSIKSGPLMPSGNPGKFSTSVVVINCPPAGPEKNPS